MVRACIGIETNEKTAWSGVKCKNARNKKKQQHRGGKGTQIVEYPREKGCAIATVGQQGKREEIKKSRMKGGTRDSSDIFALSNDVSGTE